MAIENGTQIKVVLPGHLHQQLESEAENAAVPVASVVRMIIAGHYAKQDQARRQVASLPRFIPNKVANGKKDKEEAFYLGTGPGDDI